MSARDNHSIIHLNPGYFVNDEDEMVNCTTPHELAHWAEHKIYGEWERFGVRQKRSVHGSRWKAIMAVLGADDARTHNMDTSHVKKKTKKKYHYVCEGRCGKDLTLSSVAHNRIVRGTHRYSCNCGGTIKLKKALGQVSYAEAREARTSQDRPKRPTAPRTPKAPAAGTKKAQALTIYQDIVGRGHGKDTCIQRFMDVLNMSKSGATTYYYNCKKELS